MNKTILILLLLSSLAIATTVNLGYSECQSYTTFNETDNSTANITVCAPTQNVCPPPSHVDLNLLWGQNASANNVSASCQSWYDTNITVCPPPTSPPPIVNLSLAWGQTATQNNFTASCQPWYDTNITTCPTCDILPQVSYNLRRHRVYEC